ncbi:MAG: M56 family metallopeptidase [Oscillospiraceae bacterium]
MIEAVISSSVLILIIIFVRTAFKGKIKSTVRYALWLIAAVRLMLPISLSESAVSVMNLAEQLIPKSVTVEEMSEQTVIYEEKQPYIPDGSVSPESHEQYDAQTVYVNDLNEVQNDVQTPSEEKNFSGYDILRAVRIGVTAVMLVWFAAVNLLYSHSLRKSRKAFDYKAPLRIFTVEKLTSPFIFGLFYPAIYIPESSSDDSEAVEYIVTHELCHFYHGDMFWTVLRNVLLSVYWFDPFVWAAAILSKRDCECACDEAAISRLGEERRFRYGKAIIDLIPQKRGENFGVASTSMASGKEVLKERMQFIASNPRNKVYALIFSLLIVMLAAGSTFTSAQSYEEVDETADNAENTPVSAVEDNESDSISVSVNDYTGAVRQLVYFAAPEGYEPYIYIDEYVPAAISEPLLGEALESFAENSRFTSADIMLDGNDFSLNKSENADKFNAIISSLADISPEYSANNNIGEPFAKVSFSRSNGGFSSSLCIELYRDGERVSVKLAADDFSGLTDLLFGEIPAENELENAYNSSVHFESELFYADSLFEALNSVFEEEKQDETPDPVYESFGTDMFSDNIAAKLNVTGEIPSGFIRYEYGDIAFGVPKDGSVIETGGLFLWQSGDMNFKLSASASDSTVKTSAINGEFGGQSCCYYEEDGKAEIAFADENGSCYLAVVGFKNASEKETAIKILGSFHIVSRPKPVYKAPIALSAEPSIYGDENYETSRGYGYTSAFCANTAGMLNVSFCLTDKTREYETDFNVYIERLEPDGKWYRVIPLGEMIQQNKGYRHFYTDDETGRIPACLDLSCYPLLPEGEYRLVKPYRAVGETEEKYAALYNFKMDGTLAPENELLCTAEVTDKEITSDTEEISYTVSASKVMFVISENVDIEMETEGVWRSVRTSSLRANTSHASFPLAFSGDYSLSTAGFDISQSGRYRLRISYGNCDKDLYVKGNGYNTAYAEFTVK